jgi:seryl-tRNA synthetase
LKNDAIALKEQTREVELRRAETRDALLRAAVRLPNVSHRDVPIGGEADSKLVKQVFLWFFFGFVCLR